MADCKLDLLKTEFSPYKISLVIELAPPMGEEFTLPMEDAGKKLSAVANYARETFAVRSAPVGPPEAGSQGDTAPPLKGEKKQRDMLRLLKGGADRAIKVLEGELARATKEKDTAGIASAKERIARALEMKKRNEASA